MKEIDFDLFVREKREKYFSLPAKLGRRRLPRRRPRDNKEREILLKLDKARWEKWVKTKRIVFLGPRVWRIRLEKQ